MSKVTESTSKVHENKRDIFSAYRQNIEKCFSIIDKTVPQYTQAISNLQQEYFASWKNLSESAIAVQQRFATRSGISTTTPDVFSKVARSATEEIVKAYDIQNQVNLASIDATKQNIKTFNDNASAFADLNQNIINSWISAWNTTRN